MAGFSDRGLFAVLGGEPVRAATDHESRVGGLRRDYCIESNLFIPAARRRSFRRCQIIMNREVREAFALIAQEQEEDRRFHEMLVAEVAKHPERTMDENLRTVSHAVVTLQSRIPTPNPKK
jgi:hypothetical protein